MLVQAHTFACGILRERDGLPGLTGEPSGAPERMDRTASGKPSLALSGAGNGAPVRRAIRGLGALCGSRLPLRIAGRLRTAAREARAGVFTAVLTIYGYGAYRRREPVAGGEMLG